MLYKTALLIPHACLKAHPDLIVGQCVKFVEELCLGTMSSRNGQPLCEHTEFKVLLVVECVRKAHRLDYAQVLKSKDLGLGKTLLLGCLKAGKCLDLWQ